MWQGKRIIKTGGGEKGNLALSKCPRIIRGKELPKVLLRGKKKTSEPQRQALWPVIRAEGENLIGGIHPAE